jgi:hypothetical protein
MQSQPRGAAAEESAKDKDRRDETTAGADVVEVSDVPQTN